MLIKIRFMPFRLVSLLAFAALLSGMSVAQAQAQFEEDVENESKAWQEIAVQLPAAPQVENLLPFYVSATATQSFAIDAKSLTVGSDGVIRYTMVSTSPEGARNISYEGIRCRSFEKKVYAIGQSDGNWSRSRRDQWERIVQNASNRQHSILAKDYFCRSLTVAGKPEKMLERIRWQQPLTQQFGN